MAVCCDVIGSVAAAARSTAAADTARRNLYTRLCLYSDPVILPIPPSRLVDQLVAWPLTTSMIVGSLLGRNVFFFFSYVLHSS